MNKSVIEFREVAKGLWIWRVEHPDWVPNQGWDPIVASTFVESGGEILVLDPIAPQPAASEIWKRPDAKPPTAVVVLKPDHVRHVDLFAKRYGARGFGPERSSLYDLPETPLEPIQSGSQLPGGIIALNDGRGKHETPLWLPEQHTIVFADAMTAPRGELRVWITPWHEEKVLPAFRAMLELPFEHVVVSHGDPVHSRADFERALTLPPWNGE